MVPDTQTSPLGRVPEAVTVTAQVAVLPPSAVVTVIVAFPAATGVTTPEMLTDATEVLLEAQVTLLFVAFDGLTVAVSVPVAPPTVNESVVGLNVTPVTATFCATTVAAQVAVFPPSAVVTVIVAVPAATGVTTPALTVATAVLLDDQVTFVFVAFEGLTVAVSVPVAPPTVNESVVGLKATPVTATACVPTVTAQVAVLPPSTVVTVIVAVPAATGVTTPELLTVATVVLLDDQFTFLFAAFDGLTVAVSEPVAPPTTNESVVGLKVTPVTAALCVPTVTAQVAVLPPSAVVTVIVAVPVATGVTMPEPLTVATEGLLDVQVTSLFVASDGLTVAVSVPVAPLTANESVVGLRLTSVTETVVLVEEFWQLTRKKHVKARSRGTTAATPGFRIFPPHIYRLDTFRDRL
jgi:copper chaperone CopZ